MESFQESKSRLELEYELRLTKKILERIIELNKDKDIIMPNTVEVDEIEQSLRTELEKDYPKFKIKSKR